MNNEKEESERKRNLNRWLAFRRWALKNAKSFQIDGGNVIAAVDREIETATKQVKCFEELNDSDFAAIQYAFELPHDLIAVRAILGWSQPLLGAQVGLTRQQISRYENSNYSDIALSKAILIAQVMQPELADRKLFQKSKQLAQRI